MRTNRISMLTAVVLLVAGAWQQAWAQMVVLHTVAGETVEYSISQLDSISFEEHEWVDLGLPSGTLWAKCNVGAKVPESSGDYFAWGETTPKSNYSWSSYVHCNGKANRLTKYCTNSSYGDDGFTDDLTELMPEDDAATANWGEKWQTPDSAQLAELFDAENSRTNWENRNGRWGWLVTSCHNGRSIFMPLCGSRSDGDYNDVNEEGCYMTRTLLANHSPLIIFYQSINRDFIRTSESYRYVGYSVRPVRKKHSTAFKDKQ